MTRDEVELEGALRLQFEEMGYGTEVKDGPRGQFSLYSLSTDEWWVVTLVGECPEGDIELARHFRSDRDDRIGYFLTADPKCFEKMDAHIKADVDAPPRIDPWLRLE